MDFWSLPSQKPLNIRCCWRVLSSTHLGVDGFHVSLSSRLWVFTVSALVTTAEVFDISGWGAISRVEMAYYRNSLTALSNFLLWTGCSYQIWTKLWREKIERNDVGVKPFFKKSYTSDRLKSRIIRFSINLVGFLWWSIVLFLSEREKLSSCYRFISASTWFIQAFVGKY